jgi:hypothetical protein
MIRQSTSTIQVYRVLDILYDYLTTVAALLVGRSRDRFLVVSLGFSVTYSFQLHHGPGVDSTPSENEHQEHFLGVKVAGA